MQVENIFLPKGLRSLEEANVPVQHSATLSIRWKPRRCFAVNPRLNIIWEKEEKKRKKYWVTEDQSNQVQYWHTDATCQFGIEVCLLHKALLI